MITEWLKYTPRRIRMKLSLAALTLTALLCGGCDPVVDFAGADFPAWLICAIAGIARSVRKATRMSTAPPSK